MLCVYFQNSIPVSSKASNAQKREREKKFDFKAYEVIAKYKTIKKKSKGLHRTYCDIGTNTHLHGQLAWEINYYEIWNWHDLK